MKNLTTSEVHKIRPTFTKTLEGIRNLDGKKEAPKGPSARGDSMQYAEELRGRDNDIGLEDYGMELDDTIIYD